MEIEIITNSLLANSQEIVSCGKTVSTLLEDIDIVRRELENVDDNTLRDIGYRMNSYVASLEGQIRNIEIMGLALEKTARIYNDNELKLEDWTEDSEAIISTVQNTEEVVRLDWQDIQKMINIDTAVQEGIQKNG